MIKGTTRLLGVMGWPVKHSKSPQMHAAAIAGTGLDLAYVALPVDPAKVGDAVRGLPALGFLGANVTIPHKQAVMEHLDEILPAAEGIGAVNTIIVDQESGKLSGTNTDADGAWEALLEETNTNAKGKNVVVLGAGGAGRAVAWGAGARKAKRVLIVNRTRSKAEDLAADMQRQHPKTEFVAVCADDQDAFATTDIVMQTTSLGMKDGDALPLDPKFLPESAVGLEAVYAPEMTAWRAGCIERGMTIIDGFSMLVGQGAKAFEIWTRIKPDSAAMKKAIL